jgi:hypothetical protein
MKNQEFFKYLFKSRLTPAQKRLTDLRDELIEAKKRTFLSENYKEITEKLNKELIECSKIIMANTFPSVDLTNSLKEGEVPVKLVLLKTFMVTSEIFYTLGFVTRFRVGAYSDIYMLVGYCIHERLVDSKMLINADDFVLL